MIKYKIRHIRNSIISIELENISNSSISILNWNSIFEDHNCDCLNITTREGENVKYIGTRYSYSFDIDNSMKVFKSKQKVVLDINIALLYEIENRIPYIIDIKDFSAYVAVKRKRINETHPRGFRKNGNHRRRKEQLINVPSNDEQKASVPIACD